MYIKRPLFPYLYKLLSMQILMYIEKVILFIFSSVIFYGNSTETYHVVIFLSPLAIFSGTSGEYSLGRASKEIV